MNKVIGMTACARPQYLKETLDSLSQNCITDWLLHISCEPNFPETLKVIEDYKFAGKSVHVNQSRLGVRMNPYTMLDRLFTHGADVVFYGEEDVILAPDAFYLADWFIKLPEDVQNKYVCLNMYTHNSNFYDSINIYEGKDFAPLWAVITKYQWENYFKPAWNTDFRGWDWSMTELLKNNDVYTLTPGLSRSHHIGRDDKTSVHYRTWEHDKLYVNNILSDIREKLDYKIIRLECKQSQ